MNKNNPYYNNEGYADPTAFYGTKQIVKEEAETERRANELIKVLKFIIRSCGFELIERVKIKDTKTGKGVQIMEQIQNAVLAAFEEFKKEFGENAKLEEGDEFVTVFNNCTLIISIEDGTLRERFIGGKPYRVDMSLAIYEGGANE